MSRYLFIVQGEGRGHLTQAIALRQLLQAHGHEVTAALIGVAKGKQLPTFFTSQFNAPYDSFLSPHLIFTRKGISFLKTIRFHLTRGKYYWNSLRVIHKAVAHHRPDVIVNFYDAIGGVYALLYRPKLPIVAVGHHYLFLHPDFEFPAKRGLDYWLLRFNTQLTAARASKLLALSFREMTHDLPRKIIVVPPLLREEVKALSVTNQNFVLAYITYASMSNAIIDWHQRHSHIKLHCFWDNPTYPEVYQQGNNLTFHQVHAQKFLTMMAQCSGLITTAGFESVCEAMYLGKPTLMVPAHYEQLCNAWDAQKAGAGIAAEVFDMNLLLNYLPEHQDIKEQFGHWCDIANDQILGVLEGVLISSKPPSLLHPSYS